MKTKQFPLRPTRAEISLENLKNNFNQIKLRAGDKKICAVVKADAYGHGLEAVRTLYNEGSDYFAVAFTDEGVVLRRNGFEDIPILILGPSTIEQVEEIVDNNLIPTVFDYPLAKALSDYAVKQKKEQPVHIKVDTGMNRIGVDWDNGLSIIEEIARLPNLKLEGIFTHFATADEADKDFTHEQITRFNCLLDELEQKGIEIPLKHAENSAAVMDLDLRDFNMIRPGIVLYGHYPSEEVKKENLKIKPVMRFLSKVSRVKTLEPGETVGYGRTYTAKEPVVTATVPVGYADGYSRILSHKDTEAFLNGKRVPVIGNICMDQMVLDVTGVNGVEVGDDVELFGNEVPAEEIAEKLGTISYEVTCMVNKRVPRVYIEDNQVKAINNELLDKGK